MVQDRNDRFPSKVYIIIAALLSAYSVKPSHRGGHVISVTRLTILTPARYTYIGTIP